MKIAAIVLFVIFVIWAVLAGTGAVNIHSHALGLNGHPHLKHTILFAILAVLCAIWYRFASNASASSSR